jgi:sugar phosphate permease
MPATRSASAQTSAAVLPPPQWRGWFVWAIPATFYLTAFFFRASPAVMTSELMRDFHISAKELGTLSAFYFYAYVLMQIPVGVLVDSWGAKRLLVLGSLASALGTFVFATTDNFVLACAGRALVGAATAVGWIVTLKIATHWFPSRSFAMITGLGLFIGNLGALFAQVPLRLLVDSFGWRIVVISSAGFVLAIGTAAWLGVRNDPAEKGFLTYAPDALTNRKRQTLLDILKGFNKILQYRNTWLIFLAQGGFVGSVLAFTGLWGPAYLKTRFGLSSTSAAAVCSVMIVCWAGSSPFYGRLSDAIGRRKSLYLGGAVGMALGWSLLFYLPGLSLTLFIAIAALTSISAGAVILGFAYSKESVPVTYLGTISGATNMGNMIGPMLLQPSIGWMLDRRWAGGIANGTRVYGVDAFQFAFLLVVVWTVLTCVFIALTKETGCKQNA